MKIRTMLKTKKIRTMLWMLTMALAVLAFGTGVAQDMAGEEGVSVAENDRYGQYLTDSEGNALYVFVRSDMPAIADELVTEGVREIVAECTGGCLEAWPPFTFTADGEVAFEGEGLNAESFYTMMIGEFNQVVFNGYPLYTFANDAAPGDTNGQGIEGGNGTWYLMSPDGSPIDASDESEEAG